MCNDFTIAFLDDGYRQDLTRDECVHLLAKAIHLAMARDGHSGGSASICIVDSSGCNFLAEARSDSTKDEIVSRRSNVPLKDFADPIHIR